MFDSNFISKSNPQEENNTNTDESNEPSTYLCIGNENDGQLEIDLIQFREKNVSMRYLSFTFSGINPKTGQVQSAFINIDNEDAFETIKKFFNQLDWNS
jgi:hypothetical protein